MAIKRRFRGKMKKGMVILPPHILEAYNAEKRKYKDDEDVEVTISRPERPNSKNQQRYYRGVICKWVAEAMGGELESSETAHAYLQPMFFMYYDDNRRPYIRSTEIGEWNTVDWERKMQDIRNWFFEFFGYEIPLPNQIEGY